MPLNLALALADAEPPRPRISQSTVAMWPGPGLFGGLGPDLPPAGPQSAPRLSVEVVDFFLWLGAAQRSQYTPDLLSCPPAFSGALVAPGLRAPGSAEVIGCLSQLTPCAPLPCPCCWPHCPCCMSCWLLHC